MIQLPSEPKLVSRDGDFKAIFEISPLYPGYGMTIGNSLRRVLISSLEGAAVTSVKIKGVLHEFSTIPNVLEDVIEVILNLKKVRVRVFSDESVILILKTSKEGAVTAADIKSTDEAQVINVDQHIATLSGKKSELEMELTVEKGVGYIPVEQKDKEKLSVGVIAIDGIFTPIRNVNFKVENIRVGQRTDYNRVLLEIETDGSVLPEDAIQKAAKILVDHYGVISNIEIPKDPSVIKKDKAPSKKTKAKTSEMEE